MIQSGDKQLLYTPVTLNVIQTRQLIDLKKSSVLFWMGRIVDQSQERSKLQQDMVPFYLSTSSRKDIAIAFKEIHPEWPFCVPTIMREFPQNAVTPATSDLEQNTCPVCANACCLNNAINRAIKKSVTDTLPSSCHDLVYLLMCNTENIIPSDLVSPELGNVEIKFSQWCYEKKIIRKEKNANMVPDEKTVF